MVEQFTRKFEWKSITAHVGPDGKLHFDDITYYFMPEKLVIDSLWKEGWLLMEVVPFPQKDTENIMKENFWWNLRKKIENFVGKPVQTGGTYYFKRLRIIKSSSSDESDSETPQEFHTDL